MKRNTKKEANNSVELNNAEDLLAKNRKDLTPFEKEQLKLFLKANKKGFFGLVWDYIKIHWLMSLLILLVTAISAFATVVGPKITERLMGTLMAAQMEHEFSNSLIQILLDNDVNAPAFTGGNFGEWINAVQDAVNAQQPGLNLNINNMYNEALHNGYSFVNFDANSNNYFAYLFNMHLNWTGWIYVQLCMFGLIAICTFVSNYFAGMLGRRMEIDLRNKTLERLVKQDISYYSDKKIGEILTKIVSDTQIIGEQASQVPIAVVSAFLTFFGSLGVMATINGKLTIVVVVAMVLLLAIMMSMFMIVRRVMFKVRKSITSINGDVTDRINTVRLIKASGTEEYETNRFKEEHKDYYKKSKTLISMQSIIITVMVAGISSIQVVIIIAGAIMYHDDIATLSVVLTSFISGVGTMISPIMQMVRIISGLVQASTASQRVFTIMNSKSRLDPHYAENDGIMIDNISGDIIFKDITFAYPEKPEQLILPKFNFTFENGKSYAFVGETGVGKSTISKLLLRFYDPTTGEVLINNKIDLKDIHLSSYLDKVGYVEQEPQILFGNVYDNIRYARFDASDEEVMEAAKKAELHELIQSWPQGYDTILGERGFMLSGGQKQRLVIARMFLKNPQLLILDEATSALDNIVEKEIQGNLEELMKGRTTISIAHRLSTIKNSDQIIVLAKGVGVAQVGTFNELRKVSGHFKDLYEAGLMD
ncbi:ABC transporter ATP-binding protein [Spiroplasma endosymbiont of Labia minor]|uniref:ABC transporter ATP-binding protein n=1 Tax=Spiroplasma endosymbiont of Labia minor TaxID=3066305 RepID=UPI0030CEFE36